jgi:hypothetical protein
VIINFFLTFQITRGGAAIIYQDELFAVFRP